MTASTITVYNPSASALSSTPYVAGYVAYDGGPSRIYTNAAAIAAGGASTACPTLTTITQVTATDGAFPDPSNAAAEGGPYVMKLTPATTDTVNASSPMSRIYLSPNAFVITISS